MQIQRRELPMNIIGAILNRTGLVKLSPAVFLHIPKTAGTTIVNLAQRHYGCARVSSHGDFVGVQAEELANKDFVSGHFGYEFASKIMPGRFSFTFLRDPIERIVSSYYFCQTRDPNEFPEYKLAQENSLERYLELTLESKQGVWNRQCMLLAQGWVNEKDLSDEELVRQAILHLDTFSYVGFTETFDQDSRIITSKLGMMFTDRGKRSNVTPNRPDVKSLPVATKNLLDRVSELDRQVYDHAWSHRTR